MHTNANTATTTSRITVHQAAGMRFSPGLSSMSLPGQVEVAGLPVYGERDQRDFDGRNHHRGTHRPAHGLTYPGRPPARGEPVERGHEHDDDRHRNTLKEGPDEIGGTEERVEVMVIHTRPLAVDGGR